MKKYWHIFWLFRRMHLQRSMEYRANFFFWTFISTMWTVFNFFYFDLIAGVNGSIGGWNRWEMFLLLGVFTILDTFTWSFFYHNMSAYTQSVFNGDLAQFLTKPVDTQFILMTQGNSYSNVFRFLLGLGVIGLALHKLDFSLTILSIFWFVILMTCALLFIYFIWFIFSTFAFWVDKLDNINEVIPAIRRIWQVPRGIFTGTISLVVTVFFPMGLVSSLPSEVLLQQFDWAWIGYFLVVTIITIFLSRAFFFTSVKRFSGIAN